MNGNSHQSKDQTPPQGLNRNDGRQEVLDIFGQDARAVGVILVLVMLGKTGTTYIEDVKNDVLGLMGQAMTRCLC